MVSDVRSPKRRAKVEMNVAMKSSSIIGRFFQMKIMQYLAMVMAVINRIMLLQAIIRAMYDKSQTDLGRGPSKTRAKSTNTTAIAKKTA